MAEAQQGVAYIQPVSVFDAADPGRIKLNPTIAVGDFKRSTDGGTLTNLTNLPVEMPAGSGIILCSLTAAEMGSGGPATGSVVVLKYSRADLEWTDGSLPIIAPVHTAASALTALLAVVQTSGVVMSAAGAAAVADVVLDRDMAAGTDTGSSVKRTVRDALRFLRNRWEIVGTLLTVYKENDSTGAWTAPLTGGAADPVTGMNPTGP